jgi:hypothetical protein
MEAIQAAEPNLDSLSVLSARDWDDPKGRGLRRQIGKVMSSYVHMTMSIVCQFPDLDPDRDDPNARPLNQSRSFPVKGSSALEIGEVLRAAEADLDKVAALSSHIGAEGERSEFRRHVAKVSALYQEVTDAVAHGHPPGLDCKGDSGRRRT